MKELKGVTLWEPWATLVALREKGIETRSWATNYRGLIASQSARTTAHMNTAWKEPFFSALKPVHIQSKSRTSIGYNLGCIIAICNLVDCIKMTDENIAKLSEKERMFGYYEPGRYMWLLKEVIRLEKPIPVKGKQRIWNLDSQTIVAVQNQITGKIS